MKTKPHISWCKGELILEVWGVGAFNEKSSWIDFTIWRDGIQRRGRQGWPQ
jgi:hypothetical protein